MEIRYEQRQEAKNHKKKENKEMKRQIFYIETTLNGYVLKQIEICEWKRDYEFIEDLLFTRDGEKVDYYQDLAGDMDELDTFLKYANCNDCEDYENYINNEPNVYLEYWLTNSLGYYEERYIGLMIK